MLRQRDRSKTSGSAAMAAAAIAALSGVGATLAVATGGIGWSPRAPISHTKAQQSLSIRATPFSSTIEAGKTTTYMVRVRPRTRVRVRLTGALPEGASLLSRRIRSSPWKRAMTIRTLASTPAGNYTLELEARRGSSVVETEVVLIVSAEASSQTHAATPPPAPVPEAFRIAGSLPALLVPGSSEPVDLALTNLGDTDLQITGLGVRVGSVSAPESTANRPCGIEDFAVAPFSGAYGFTLPGSSTMTLAELGLPVPQWPRVAMLNRPTNQNGCMRARITLAFTGTATGEEP
jgi:hypothetical protein